MALAGGIGAELVAIAGAGDAFGEDQGRYVVTGRDLHFAYTHKVPVTRIGTTGGNAVAGVPLDVLRTAHEGFFPKLMGTDAALA
jgi:phosphoribosylformylglycinamidine synthase